MTKMSARLRAARASAGEHNAQWPYQWPTREHRAQSVTVMPYDLGMDIEPGSTSRVRGVCAHPPT